MLRIQLTSFDLLKLRDNGKFKQVIKTCGVIIRKIGKLGKDRYQEEPLRKMMFKQKEICQRKKGQVRGKVILWE